MKKVILIIAGLLFYNGVSAQNETNHDLKFDTLARHWDEAIPLGNGMLGALIWQKGDHLRFSLDRADLWDLRPMKVKNLATSG
jgi:alpha-L-fucosidase 2